MSTSFMVISGDSFRFTSSLFIILLFLLLFIYSSSSQYLNPLDESLKDSSLVLMGRWPKGPCKVIAVEGNIVYVGNGSNFEIVDYSNLSDPELLGELMLPFPPLDISLLSNLALVALGRGGLGIVDISNKHNPSLLKIFETWGVVNKLIVDGDYAYLSCGTDGLRIISIVNPSIPLEISVLNTLGEANGISKFENLIILGEINPSRCCIIDVTDPHTPVEISSIGTPGDTKDIITLSDIVYVAGGFWGIDIFDLSDPVHPVTIQHGITQNDTYDLAIWGNLLIAANGSKGLQILDISTPTNPQIIGEYDTEGITLKVAINEQVVYLADDNDDLKVFDITVPSQPDQIGTYETGIRFSSLAATDNYAYLLSYSGKLKVVDISDPSKPLEVGFWETNEISSYYFSDIEIYGDFAFISDMYGDLIILNISDPTHPVEVSSLPIYPADMDISGNIALVSTNGAAYQLISYDITNPVSPVRLDSIPIDAYSYSVQTMGDQVFVLGTNTVGGTLRCIDFSDPLDLSQISKIHIGHFQEMAAADGYLYIDLGTALGIYNVTDPATPTLKASLNIPAFIADIQISNDFGYIAAFSGLWVIDHTVKTNPALRSYFKTNGVSSCINLLPEYLLLGEINDGLYIFLKDTIITTTQDGSCNSNFSDLDVSIYPNPFNNYVEIVYNLDKAGSVNIKVYNSTGQCISELINRRNEAGINKIQWKAEEKSSGIYFIRIESSNSIGIKKCILVK